MRRLKISESITVRNHHSLDIYLSEVNKYDLVSAEEEVKLAERIGMDDNAALQRLVNANLRFVISVAKQYQHQGLVLEDLINEGNLGLITAAQRFDASKGFKFISYAVWWIRQSIMAAISVQSRTVRLPGNQVSNLIKLNKSRVILEHRLEREPTIDELAAEMDVSSDKIKLSLSNSTRQVSLDAPFNFFEDSSLLDTIPNEGPTTDHGVMVDSVKVDIQHLLEKLPLRERTILVMFYGLQNTGPKTLGEIADHLGLTSERIRQIKKKAIIEIRDSSWGKNLATYQ